jgi:hypothetical protein
VADQPASAHITGGPINGVRSAVLGCVLHRRGHNDRCHGGNKRPGQCRSVFPPSHLKGTIHVLLTAQPWSDDSGHFGGFHTTATLKNVEFKVSHGELQLEDHDGWLLPFTITQTLPAGLSGTCTAMWPFVNEHLEGNVAGFSESPAGKETATVSLGFSEVAQDPSGGCGADLVETTHPFGEDPERFDISIQSRSPCECQAVSGSLGQ